MKRIFALSASALCSVALLAVAAAPASAAPSGGGLVDFGTVTCEGFGEVSIFGPSGELADTAFATTGQHVVLLSIDVTGTDPFGNPIDFSKTYGQKAGLTAFTCTQHFEEGGASGDITAVVAVVPPQ